MVWVVWLRLQPAKEQARPIRLETFESANPFQIESNRPSDSNSNRISKLRRSLILKTSSPGPSHGVRPFESESWNLRVRESKFSLQATSTSPSNQNKDSIWTPVHCRTWVLHHCLCPEAGPRPLLPAHSKNLVTLHKTQLNSKEIILHKDIILHFWFQVAELDSSLFFLCSKTT